MSEPRKTRLWGRAGLVMVFLAVLLLASAAPAAAQTPAPEPVVYVVQSGDTLSEIAAQFGVTVDAIVQANHLDDPRLIVSGQQLVIPAAAPGGEPTPGAQTTYVIQPGDTLAAIAAQFGVSVQAIAEANGIADPAVISPGQTLVIPTAGPGPAAPQTGFRRLHTLRAGETLPALAFRYGATPWALELRNGLLRSRALPLGKVLEIPDPTVPTPASPRMPEVVVSPAPLLQGQTALVSVRSSAPLTLTGTLLDLDLSFSTDEGGAWALAGVDVLTDPGSYRIALSAVESGTGDRLLFDLPVDVAAGSFSRYNVVVPADRTGLLDPTLSNSERQKIKAVFGRVSSPKRWQGVFSLPATGSVEISAGFGQKRSYNGGPVSSYHTGLDYDAEGGAPVHATAGGIVVMAEPLDVRGNVVILDHGMGVFTGFWHLSRIDVTVGQTVERGAVVGLVGNTGLSTGPHLHWEMRVRGVPVDPLQWTQQEFP